MITCELVGRLGNQLFQISNCVAHALKNGVQYKIPLRTQDPRVWPIYFTHLPRLSPSDKILHHYKEPEFSYQPIPFQDNTCLHGYFQSEKYFADYRNEILTAFRIPYKPLKGVVSIHVRRGDYLQFADKHPPITKEYLHEAIKLFPNYNFLVFSDDMKWCREILTGPQFSFAEKNTPLKDIELMSGCEHNIIANSSFSWWGAWLNQNPDKIVIAPNVWFGPGNDHLNTKDLIPESWIRI